MFVSWLVYTLPHHVMFRILNIMKPILHIWPQPIKFKGETVKVSARLALGDVSHELWYELPSSYESSLPANSDHFLVATVLMAMRHSRKIQIHGSVSASLLRNMEEYQAAWSRWIDLLQPVPIVADSEEDEADDHTEASAIATFTGGVDSSYTVYRHAKKLVGRRSQPLKSGLFVHGFDIPLNQASVYDSAFKRAEVMLNSVGVDAIPMATNFREIMDPYLRWTTSFGSALGACLLLFQKKFNTGLIASSYCYQTLSFPYGSNSITDPMMGNNKLSIIYDGAEERRIGKARLIAEWPEAMKYLRVCWQGAQKDVNCCECEKCIRNILTFRIVRSSLPECFKKDTSDEMLANFPLQAGGPLDSLKALYHAACQNNVNASWVRVLRKKIKIKERRVFIKKFSLRRLLKKSTKDKTYV